MKTAEVINTLDKRFKKIRKHYNNLLADFRVEEIHDFRLEMKRLRAILRLLNTDIAYDGKLKLKGDIKAFYHVTGDIRNLQLHEQRINYLCHHMVLEKPQFYFHILDEEAVQHKQLAHGLSERISLKQVEEKFLDLLQGGLRGENARTFVIQKYHALMSLLALPGYYDEGIHDIRKILKDILYNWQYIRSCVPVLLPLFFTDKKNIEGLAQKMGDFHDFVVALYFFNTTYLDKIGQPTELQVLHILKSKLENDKNDLKEEITTLLNLIKAEIGIGNIFHQGSPEATDEKPGVSVKKHVHLHQTI